jgi:hypothetical protein
MFDGNEELFESYLKNEAKKRGGGLLSSSTIQSYISTLFSLSRKLIDEGIIKCSLFEINDMRLLTNLHEIILHGNYEISKQNKTQNRIFSAALYHYIRMLSLQPEDDNFEEIVRPMAAYRDGSFDQLPASDLDYANLFKKMKGTPKRKETISILQEKRNRAQAVKEITLSRANDRCDLCGKKTFLLPNGHYFLECHHLIYLSNNGVDSIINTVALCPNCHRMMHLGLMKERDDSFENLLRLVHRYVEDEMRFDKNIQNDFLNYFSNNNHPEVISF